MSSVFAHLCKTRLIQYNWPMNDLSYDDTYRTHYLHVSNYCLTLLHSREDAEDIAQDTFLRAWQLWQEFDSTHGVPIFSWLCGIAYYKSLNLIKKRIIRARPYPFIRSETYNSWPAINALIDISTALSKLKARERQAIYASLLYAEDWRAASASIGMVRYHIQLRAAHRHVRTFCQ